MSGFLNGFAHFVPWPTNTASSWASGSAATAERWRRLGCVVRSARTIAPRERANPLLVALQRFAVNLRGLKAVPPTIPGNCGGANTALPLNSPSMDWMLSSPATTPGRGSVLRCSPPARAARILGDLLQELIHSRLLARVSQHPERSRSKCEPANECEHRHRPLPDREPRGA